MREWQSGTIDSFIPSILHSAILILDSNPSFPSPSFLNLVLDVFLHRPRSDLSAVEVAGVVGDHAFGGARARRVLLGIGDEELDFAVFRAADAHATSPSAGMILRTRFGIDTV